MDIRVLIIFVASLLQNVFATKINIKASTSIHEVNDNFISYCVDAAVLGISPKWLNFNFSSPLLHTVMSGLAPATLRFGGSPADWTVFADDDQQAKILNTTGILPSLTVFTKSDLDNMVNLTLKTGTRFLYDFNLQLRYGTQWDPTNALKMFDYMQSKGYGSNVDFELGNEPGAYNKPGEIFVIPPKIIAEDFVRLHKLMRAYPNLKDSLLFGPDLVGFKPFGRDIFNEVAEVAGDYIKGMTFHQYYFRGDTATVKDYINASHFSDLQGNINDAKNAIANTSHADIQLWLGETSDSWHSGTVNVSNRFVSGFLWLDKLGLAAKNGISVVMRQTLYSHNYGLIDLDLSPNSDYWLSWIHKTLVGTKVLNAIYSSAHQTTRVYAHCTNYQRSGYKKGAVTMFALNVNTSFADTLVLDPPFKNQTVDIYFFTPPMDDPEGILSKHAAVNGDVLMLQDDLVFPKLVPVKEIGMPSFKLPPLTMAFFVFPSINAPACL